MNLYWNADVSALFGVHELVFGYVMTLVLFELILLVAWNVNNCSSILQLYVAYTV